MKIDAEIFWDEVAWICNFLSNVCIWADVLCGYTCMYIFNVCLWYYSFDTFVFLSVHKKNWMEFENIIEIIMVKGIIRDGIKDWCSGLFVVRIIYSGQKKMETVGVSTSYNVSSRKADHYSIPRTQDCAWHKVYPQKTLTNKKINEFVIL